VNGPEGELQRLRLWQRAYGDNQPTPERRRKMGEAIARYLRALRYRRGDAGDGPVGAVDPVDPVERIT
jgi:hypothetical protein